MPMVSKRTLTSAMSSSSACAASHLAADDFKRQIVELRNAGKPISEVVAGKVDGAALDRLDQLDGLTLRCRQPHARAGQDKCAHQGFLGVQQRRHLLMWPTQRNS